MRNFRRRRLAIIATVSLVLHAVVLVWLAWPTKGRQGELRLGRTPCSIPLQGSFFTPEASVPRR